MSKNDEYIDEIIKTDKCWTYNILPLTNCSCLLGASGLHSVKIPHSTQRVAMQVNLYSWYKTMADCHTSQCELRCQRPYLVATEELWSAEAMDRELTVPSCLVEKPLCLSVVPIAAQRPSWYVRDLWLLCSTVAPEHANQSWFSDTAALR